MRTLIDTIYCGLSIYTTSLTKTSHRHLFIFNNAIISLRCVANNVIFYPQAFPQWKPHIGLKKYKLYYSTK